MRAFYFREVGRPAHFDASKERDLKIMLTSAHWVSDPLNARSVSNERLSGRAPERIPNLRDSSSSRRVAEVASSAPAGADAVERHRFGIEWIRCPGTTRVMRATNLGVRSSAARPLLEGAREYSPSRDSRRDGAESRAACTA